MTVAVARDQKPPITMPRSVRATMSTMKFGAIAISASEESISPVKPVSTCRRSKRLAILGIRKLVINAKSPEIEIAWD